MYSKVFSTLKRMFTIPQDRSYNYLDSLYLHVFHYSKVVCMPMIDDMSPMNDFAGRLVNVAVWRKYNISSDGGTQGSVLCTVTVILVIERESPPSIKVSDWKKAVTLFCIPSVHPNCTYCWKMVGGEIVKFPSTPLIYGTVPVYSEVWHKWNYMAT